MAKKQIKEKSIEEALWESEINRRGFVGIGQQTPWLCGTLGV